MSVNSKADAGVASTMTRFRTVPNHPQTLLQAAPRYSHPSPALQTLIYRPALWFLLMENMTPGVAQREARDPDFSLGPCAKVHASCLRCGPAVSVVPGSPLL